MAATSWESRPHFLWEQKILSRKTNTSLAPTGRTGLASGFSVHVVERSSRVGISTHRAPRHPSTTFPAPVRVSPSRDSGALQEQPNTSCLAYHSPDERLLRQPQVQCHEGVTAHHPPLPTLTLCDGSTQNADCKVVS